MISANASKRGGDSVAQVLSRSQALRVLVIAPHWVGDAVMSLGLLQRLCEINPRLELSVLCSTVVAAVYRSSPLINEVLEAPFAHGQFQWVLRWQLARRLSKHCFDVAYILPNSFKTALTPFLANIPVRIGYGGEGRWALLTKALPKPNKNNKPPMLDWYGRLCDEWVSASSLPVLKVADSRIQSFRQRWGLTGKYLAVAPGAEYGPAKRWPSRYFAGVIEAILKRNVRGITEVVLLGGAKDLDAAQQVRGALSAEWQSSVHILVAQTSLDEAIACIAGTELVLTNDSGLMHVAAALNKPLHAVFGSSDPTHTPPLSKYAVVHYLGLECSPCFARECPLGHTRCLNDLTPETILQRLEGADSQP
jgi:heptosyltransferase-2